MSRLISFAVLIAIIIIIGLLFYKVLIGFFIPVFLACVLVVVFRPLHHWTLEKTGHRDQIAALLTTIMIVFVLFLPIVVVSVAAATQGLRLIKQNDASILLLRVERIRDSLGLQMPKYANKLRLVDDEIQTIVDATRGSLSSQENEELIRFGSQTKRSLEELKQEVQADPNQGEIWNANFDSLIEQTDAVGKPSEVPFAASDTAVRIKAEYGKLKTGILGGGVMAILREYANPTNEDVQKLTGGVVAYVQPRLLSLTGATGSFVIKLAFGSVILVVATFFFLYDGPAMVKTLMYLSPLDDSYEQELLLEFDRISRAVVLATLLSAIVQGLTAGIGYFVVGMDYLTLLIMLTTVFAMVPFVGPAVVWIPVCLYVGIYEERLLAAILLAVWGVLVVGTVDNLVKAVVLHGQSQLHPLLALLSVLGGVQALGPIGIVIGPMVVVMLQTLLSILQRELLHFEENNFLGIQGGNSESKKSRRRSKADSRKETQAIELDDLPPELQKEVAEAMRAREAATSDGATSGDSDSDEGEEDDSEGPSKTEEAKNVEPPKNTGAAEASTDSNSNRKRQTRSRRGRSKKKRN